MRYLIDTNIFVFLALDAEMLSGDTAAIIQKPDTVLCISTESVRELITGYRTKGLGSKRWKSAEEIINAIKDEFFINIIPVKTEHLRTYARLRLNTQQDHKDPSDHVIISHAITEHLPASGTTAPKASTSSITSGNLICRRRYHCRKTSTGGTA